MLAPRKTLWSTPAPVIQHVIGCLSPLQASDEVCDIGCGDGRCILEWAAAYSRQLLLDNDSKADGSDDNGSSTDTTTKTASFIGIDIDEARVQQAKDALALAREAGEIHASVSVQFHCANALDQPELFQKATIVFLYLIPRGLKCIQPLLMRNDETEDKDTETIPAQNQENEAIAASTTGATRTRKTRKIISYMAPLPNMPPSALLQRDRIPVQTGTAWPVYLYQIEQQG